MQQITPDKNMAPMYKKARVRNKLLRESAQKMTANSSATDSPREKPSGIPRLSKMSKMMNGSSTGILQMFSKRAPDSHHHKN
jgi:hypothetical protein